MARNAAPRRTVNRPCAQLWERELHYLEQIHEVELLVPADAFQEVAERLNVSRRVVLDRFNERARRVAARGSIANTDPLLLAAVVDLRDFKAAASALRDRGLRAPSFAIEAMLNALPGPAARGLRTRERSRRVFRASLASATSAPKAA